MGAGNRTEIVVAGASGLIGSALVASLRADQLTVRTLVRGEPRNTDQIQWNPGGEALDPQVLAAAAAVVVLNGAPISKLPWSKSYRQVLLDSRVQSVGTVAEAIAQLGADAPMLVCASAAGIYPSKPGVTQTEAAPVGDSFLASICVQWEAAAAAAVDQVPVSWLRTASVLHPKALLKPLLPLTKLGLAGRIGSGDQIWPWISLTDEVRAIRHVIEKQLVGPVNLVAPGPASSEQIMRALAKQLHRPYLLPAPMWLLRRILGADPVKDLLLADATVIPGKLQETGFTFNHPTASETIKAALNGKS